MAPRPYSEKSSLPSDCSNDVTSGIPSQVLPETPSPQSLSGATTPSPTPQEEISIEPMSDTLVVQAGNRMLDFAQGTPCYPTPGDIMPYDHSLPDFIRQITNQPNLANLHSLSLRVISTLISLHRMSTYLPNLRELDLEGSVLNSLRDIGCSLKNLQILKVGRCQLESLDGTFGLSSLKELYAQKNFINDVSPCSNLPHIRHIDVSGNRIRNISYAGFLSVCSKLKNIVFTGNPATEVAGYRKHVRRILPQVETLDGIPFINEDNTEEGKESEIIENSCEGSDTSSTEVPDFSSVSPSDSMNNLFECEDDSSLSGKINKQVNFSNQDPPGGSECEVQEVSSEIKSRLQLRDDFRKLSPSQNKVKKESLDPSKVLENRNVNVKQKCVSIQKLDKDIENRSKKSNFLLNADFSDEYFWSRNSELEGDNFCLPSTSTSTSSSINLPMKLEYGRPSTASQLPSNTSEHFEAEEKTISATKKRPFSAVPKSIKEDRMMDQWEGPSKLTTGTPVCGNLTAALRHRKKIQTAWDAMQNQPRESFHFECRAGVNEGKNAEPRTNGPAGDYFDADSEMIAEEDLIGEDVLAISKKWRETFRRFRSNNRARWEEEEEEEDQPEYADLLGEKK